jgi:predicted PurR-regulated permease PerM
MNKETSIKIIFLMVIALFGYIILSIGCLSVSLQKTFQLYNDKFDHLQKLILDINQDSENINIKQNKNKKIKKNKISNILRE